MHSRLISASKDFKHTLQFQFSLAQITAFAVIICTLVSLLHNTVRNLTSDVSADYAELYSFKTAASLASFLTHDLVVLHDVATSENVRKWFEDDADLTVKQDVFAETRAYVQQLRNGFIYYGVRSSGREYNLNRQSQWQDFVSGGTLDKNVKDDAWYFKALEIPYEYELNIDTDKILKRTHVWVNYKVMSADGTHCLGIICTGIKFDDILLEAFAEYKVGNIRGVVIDNQGYVQMDSADDTAELLQESDWHINEILNIPTFHAAIKTHLDSIGSYALTTTTPDVIALPPNSPYSYVGMASIEGTDWTVLTFFNSSSLFSPTKITRLAWTTLGLLVLYVLFVSIATRGLIFSPLARMIKSLTPVQNETENKTDDGASNTQEHLIYGLDRQDELGKLATTIQNLRDNLDAKNKELMTAVTKANSASDAKTNFLAHMSHEIRTPMNAIIGMAKIGKDAKSAEKIQTCFGKIETASTHLLGIINDVLDMSKIEANKIDIILSSVDFLQIIQRAANVIAFRMAEKGQTFKMDMDPDIPVYVITDAQRVAQVVTNFLSNAEKFTPKNGTITLTTRLFKRDDTHAYIKVAVQDTGIGIAKEQQSLLFTPFQQANNKISVEFGGTGLGLAICKQIIELMGGEVFLESEENQGTRVSFILPCPLPDESTVADTQDVSHIDSLTLPNFTGKKILLVEDIEINREIVMTLLEETGVSFDTAENGIQAVKAFSEKSDEYAAILMDIRMPEMDGYEAATTIRALDVPAAKKIPIIAMTANAFQEDVQRCLAVGMNAHVAKPINMSELIVALKKFVKV